MFLDHDQGVKIVPELLVRAGIDIRILSKVFDRKTPDHEWIPECAKRGWIIVSSDKGIETDPQNRQAVIESGAKIVLLDDNNSKGITWASAIIVSRNSICDLLRASPEACIISLRNTGKLTHRTRFPAKDLAEALSRRRNASAAIPHPSVSS